MRAIPLFLALVLAFVAGVPGLSGPASGAVRAAAGSGSISGTVTVPAGVDGAQVVVHVYPEHNLSVDAGWTLVAADGSYTVDGLAEGRYRVEFMGWGAGLVLQFWNGTPYYDESSVVVVGSGAVTGIDASLTLGATVSGTIRTNGGFDLTGVGVHLSGAPGQSIPDGVVGPDGRWSVRGVPTGSFWVEFDGRGVGLPREYWNGLGSPEGRSLLPLTAGQTRTGIDITLNGPVGTAAIEAYVTRVYSDLFHRSPDPSGLATWTRALQSGTPYGRVANAITGSDEYRSRMIRATYRTYLGRDAEPAGLASWLAAMRAGMQIEQMQSGFIASDEFYAQAGGTDRGWISRLYQTVLNRTPAGSEVDWWQSAIRTGMSRGAVARGFLYSTEHLTTVVDGYYVDLLGRHIDPSGKATWVGLIQRGSRDEEIIASIVCSAEYRSNV